MRRSQAWSTTGQPDRAGEPPASRIASSAPRLYRKAGIPLPRLRALRPAGYDNGRASRQSGSSSASSAANSRPSQYPTSRAVKSARTSCGRARGRARRRLGRPVLHHLGERLGGLDQDRDVARQRRLGATGGAGLDAHGLVLDHGPQPRRAPRAAARPPTPSELRARRRQAAADRPRRAPARRLRHSWYLRHSRRLRHS